MRQAIRLNSLGEKQKTKNKDLQCTLTNEFDVNYRKSSVKRNNTFYFGKETVSIAWQYFEILAPKKPA